MGYSNFIYLKLPQLHVKLGSAIESACKHDVIGGCGNNMSKFADYMTIHNYT